MGWVGSVFSSFSWSNTCGAQGESVLIHWGLLIQALRVQGRCAVCEAVTTSGVRGARVTAFPARAGALVVGRVRAFVPAQGEVVQRQLWEKVLSASKDCAP